MIFVVKAGGILLFVVGFFLVVLAGVSLANYNQDMLLMPGLHQAGVTAPQPVSPVPLVKVLLVVGFLIGVAGAGLITLGFKMETWRNLEIFERLKGSHHGAADLLRSGNRMLPGRR